MRRVVLVGTVVLGVLLGGAAPSAGRVRAPVDGGASAGAGVGVAVDAASGGAWGPVPGAVRDRGVLARPVDGPVVAPLTTTSRFGPGHRGIDLAAPVGTPVRATARGVVTFAGAVAGRRWVTVDHGWVRTTVGPLAAVLVAAGDPVERGAPLGVSGLAHGLAAVHLSARVGDRYVDPSPLLRGRPRISLVPVRADDTAASRPAPTATPVGAWRTLVR